MNEPLTLTRRGVITAAGLTALGLALPGTLTACSSSSSTNSLKFWMDIAGAANQKYFTNNVVKTFEKSEPNVKLNVTYYSGNDLRRLITTALQAKSGPDVVRALSASQDLAWSRANLLVDLNKYAPKGGWSSRISSWALKPFTLDDKIYALPMREDTMMLYYNKSLYEDKNWTAPTNRDEFEALATEAKGQGMVPIGGTNSTYGASTEWLVTFFWNHYAGTDAMYQALTGKTPWTDPVFVDAMELLVSYFKKGWVGGSTAKYYSVPQATIGAQFGSGKVAMYPQGEWFMPTLADYFGSAAQNDNEWDWAPMPSLSPSVPNPLFVVGVGGSYAINAASKHQDKAAKYLQWYYGDKQQAIQRMADVPATYNVPIPFTKSDLPTNMDPRYSRLITSVQDALASGNFGYATWTWLGPKSDTFVFEGADKVLNGKLSPKDYCAQLDVIFQKELKSNTIPPTLEAGPHKA